jgi:hypothetical protein
MYSFESFLQGAPDLVTAAVDIGRQTPIMNIKLKIAMLDLLMTLVLSKNP